MARLRRGHDALDLHGRADRALPADRLLGDDGREQVELLLEERLVVGEVEAEEGERLDERPSADGDLGSAVTEGVDGREALEDADRVVAARAP